MTEVVEVVEKVVEVVAEEGNTRISSAKTPKQISAGKRWIFTYNNYTEEHLVEIVDILVKKGYKYVIGKEVGKEGTPHLQGYIRGEKAWRPFTIFKKFFKIHWEKAGGNEDENIVYCTKEHNYLTNLRIKKPLKILKESELYEWQKWIENMLNHEPNDRAIVWLWEPNGCAGKTTFCKYLSSKYGAIPLEGKKNDILYCAAEFDSDIYIWDLERSMEEYISYGALEKIKNGYYMCSKYESKPIIRNSPHVIVFANFPPKKEALSEDRWLILNINDMNEASKESPEDRWLKEIYEDLYGEYEK